MLVVLVILALAAIIVALVLWGLAPLTARNRELLNLVAVGLLTGAGFAAVYIARQSVVDTASLTYAALFFGLYLAAHVITRIAVPNADPYLLPMAGLLTAVGIIEIYRLGQNDALKQAVWIVLGVALFGVTLLVLRRDYRRLESYKYLFGIGAVVLLVLPAMPGIGATVNGARLWIRLGPLQVQPGEAAKLFLIVFLAGYLREKREVLAQGRLKDWGPLLLIWGAAMLVLVETNDLGSALLYFGIFLAMLYVATGRGLYVALGFAALRRRRGRRVPADPARPRPRHDLAAPLDDERGLLPAHEREGPAPGLPELPARQVALLDRERRLCRARLRQGDVHDARGPRADPVPQHRLHLLRDRAGARPRGRGRAAARLHALRRARDADRAARRRRLLEAARGRPHVRLRAADVHHRRRRAADHPADRDHAAVRLATAARASSRTSSCSRCCCSSPTAPSRGSAMNRQIIRLSIGALILMTSLIVATTYWQTWAAAGLADRQDNSIQRVAQFKIKRGLIYARDGRRCWRRAGTRRSPATRSGSAPTRRTGGRARRRLLDRRARGPGSSAP